MEEEKDSIKKIKPELEKVVNFFTKELAKLRVGSASPALVEDLPVDFMGQKLTIKELGMISCPDRRQIVIQPWDRSCLESIEKALISSSLGMPSIVDKDKIRLNLPPLSKERRGDFLRVLSEKKEQARQTIRRWRDEAWKEIQDNFREGNISEDEKYRKKKKLEELISDYNEKIDNLSAKKEKEIME